MSKNSHKSIPSHIDDTEVKETFNIFTRKQGQSLIKDNMAFAHTLLHSKDLVPGILTVATTQSRLTGELSGEGVLNCVQDQYYSLIVSAIGVLLSAMDEENALASIGVNKDDLGFAMLGFLIGSIEEALGFEEGTEEELDRLAEKDPNILNFLDRHYASMSRFGLLDDKD